MDQSARLTMALDISVRLSEAAPSNEAADENAGEDGLAIPQLQLELREDDWEPLPSLDQRTADILDQVVSRWDANQQVDYMCMAERLWPMYIPGMVAKAMHISKTDLKAKATQIIEAYQERLTNAFAVTPLADKSIKELLEIASENTLHAGGKEFWEEMGDLNDSHDSRPPTLLHEPASSEDIASLESKLGITLPDDFKEYLRVSNGFSASGGGIYNGYFPDPELYGTENVNWNHEEYFQLPVGLLTIPREIEELAGVQAKGTFNFATALPIFGPVLEIGVRDIDNLWVVQPELVRKAKDVYDVMYERASKEQKKVIEQAIVAFAGSREAYDGLDWCCAKWSSGGAATMTSYASFRRYLEITTAASAESKNV